MASTASMIRSKSPLSDETIMKYAPSVFASEAHADRSERYSYIPTSDVLKAMRAEGFVPMAVGQTRCRDEGKREHTKHMLRFRHESLANTSVVVGTEIPELVLVNSHDGTSAYSLTGGIYRLVCSNGMVVGDSTMEVKVRHTGNVIGDVIEGSFSVIESMKEIGPVIEDWKSIDLQPEEREAYAEAAMALRWKEGESPISATSLLSVRRYDDRKPSLYHTFNVTQENLIRGGLRGVGSTGRRTSTRGVGSVTENLRLNKSLWQLTAKMAELKLAA